MTRSQLLEIRSWDALSADYLSRVLSIVKYPRKRRAILGCIQAGNILDAGCGPVPFLAADVAHIAKADLVLLDFSECMMRSMVHGLRHSAANFTAVVGDIRALPFSDAVYDNVLAVNSIIPAQRSDIDLMIVEIRRVLRPGGRLIAVLPAFETSLIARDHWRIAGMTDRIDESDHREFDTTGWQCFFTRDDVIALAQLAKLEIHGLQRLYFTSRDEMRDIKRIYAPHLSTDVLMRFPLYEYLLVAVCCR